MRRLALPLLVLALAAPAQAAPYQAGAIQDGPVVAGAGVAWLRDVDAGPSEMVSTASGGGRRTWLSLPAGPDDSTWLSGSGDGFVLSASLRLDEDPRVQPPLTERGAVWRARGADVLDTVVDSRCPVGAAEGGGTVLAWIRPPCANDEAATVMVGERSFPAGAGDVHVAGRYVAWPGAERAGTVVVYDAVEGREVLRTGGPSLDLLDLQSDGKVLVGLAGGGTAWSSPARPGLYPLDVRAEQALRLDGDRVLVATPRRLELMQLDDGTRRPLAGAFGHARLASADLSADRVAFARPTCGGDVVWLRDVADAPIGFTRRRLCRVRLTEPARVLIGDIVAPVARVRVRCRNASLAPCGTVVVRGRDGRRLTAGETPLEDGGPRDLLLTPAGVRQAAARARIAVRIEVRSDSRPGRLAQRPSRALLRVTADARRALRRCLRDAGDDARRCSGV